MKHFFSLLSVFFSLTMYSQNNHTILDEYMNNCQYIEALTYIDEQSPNKDLMLKKALCYKGLDNYRKAMGVLRDLSEEYPDDKAVRLELARSYMFLSDWDKGLECYDTLIEQDSTNIYYKMQKADILFRKNNYDKALSIYKSMERYNTSTNVLSRSAQCYEEMNMLDSAALYYKKAWAIDPTDAFSVARLINIGLKQDPKALPPVADLKDKKQYLEYLEPDTLNEQINPLDVLSIHNNNGIPQVRDAIRYSEIYMKRDSFNKQINLLNALGYYILDNWDSAIPRFEKCYAAGDSTLTLNRSLGISYYSLGQSEQAYPFLKKAYEQDSTNVNVMYCLGTACNDLGHTKEAVRYFTRILDRVVPSNAALYSYYRGLAIALERDGQTSFAIENYILTEKYASTNQKIALFYNIASLYDYGLNKPEEALEYYYKYRSSMEDYLKELIKKEVDEKEITDIEHKLKSLSSHITRLEKQTKNVN